MLDLPTEPFPIARLAWHFDVPLWPDGERAYQVTPRQVLLQPHRFAADYARTRAASLVFPIEITFFKRRWLILDGVHRLLKAHELGHEDILVRKVPKAFLRTMGIETGS